MEATNIHYTIVSNWLGSFDSALSNRDIAAAVELFQSEECFWRDLLTFTWNIYTAESQDEIKAMLEATLDMAKPSNWKIQGDVETLTNADGSVLECFITFETEKARGRGILKLKNGKCWCLLTSMLELKGFEEKAGFSREFGVAKNSIRTTWKQSRDEQLAELGITKQPYCLIVGGGQAGLALGARLRRLGVRSIIVEKNSRLGDIWRSRYNALCLHDPSWFQHFPYLPYPDHWPLFCPKDKMADWHEAYASIMDLVCWTSTECKSASYDSNTETWKVVLNKQGNEVVVYPKQLVLATGITSGLPNMPSFPGSETFEGDQLHSSMYRNGANWSGKRCIVIGSCNSAFDICADLWENGASEVTMVQRSSSHVLRTETILSQQLFGPWHVEGSKYTTDEADLIFASIPYKILHQVFIPMYCKVQEVDASYYDKLRASGFMLDFGDDGSGLWMKFLRSASGFTVDVGPAQLIIDGDVKLKSGVSMEEIKPSSVVLSDGSEIGADLIVYATGYGSMSARIAKLISQEVANKVGKCWGLGSNTNKDLGPWEIELRNMWKPTHEHGLWIHGGSVLQARHYSLYLALQLKARMEGIPTPVFGMPKVNYVS